MWRWLYLLPLLVGCTPIKSTQLEDTDFGRYQLYIIAATSAQDSLAPVNAFIRQVIHSELSTKGLTVVASNPDLYISYYIAQNDELTYLDPATLPWTLYPLNPLENQNIPSGSLVIDLIDANQQTIVWRGFTPQDEAGDRWQQQGREKLRQTITRMIKRFPF